MNAGWLPAHGIGGRADLPLPGELVLQAGGFVVLVSFLAVGLLWKRPRFSRVDVPGRPLPAVIQRAADSPALRLTLRGLMLALLAYLIVGAFAGPVDVNQNPAPRALYVLAWVGMVPASLVLGPVWRVLNPLRAALRCIRPPRNSGPSRRWMQGIAGVPTKLGYWPAATGLAVFVWLELVPADRADPTMVGVFLLGYAIAVTVGAVVFGERWFERGDPFEVYSTLVAALAPIGRRPDGVLTWRNPLRGLAGVETGPGLVAVLAVWWGSTVFDGLSGTTWWANTAERAGPDGLAKPLLATAALIALIALVGLSYRLATGPMAGALVSTLVPIAVGYTIAHYASLLFTEGPRGLALLVGVRLTTTGPAPLVIAAIQVTAILVGHVAGVVAAHDRVLALSAAGAGAGREGAAHGREPTLATGAGRDDPGRDDPRHDDLDRRLADQVPLVLLMIVYTMTGLYLLVIA
ncbi:MAG: hypothetical protein M3Z25_08915 [Actinomycetota bacterium]|nr:hypothetical protein [Actinomycetota bacterium]